jgi:hypothetical protein
MGLNFGDDVYNYIIEEFAPEDDPATIDALMNWLNAPSGETDYIMSELENFYNDHFIGDDYYYDWDMEDYMPTYDEIADFFQGLNMGLNFDDNVYNYLMEEYDPEYDPTTIDALMNLLNAPSGEYDYIME